MKNIRVGSRESRLAVVQSEMVMDYIKENCPEYTPELVTMKTTGAWIGIWIRSVEKGCL